MTLAIGLATVSSTDLVCWAFVPNHGEPVSSVTNLRSESLALIEAFSVIASFYEDTHVEVYCQNEAFVAAIAEHADTFPWITVRFSPTSGLLIRAAKREAARQILARLPEAKLDLDYSLIPHDGPTNRPPSKSAPLPPLTIATDGSSGQGRRHGERARSGWAWVDSNGRYSLSTVKGAKAVVAEFTAILRAINASPQKAKILIQSDCEEALLMLRMATKSEDEYRAAVKRNTQSGIRQVQAARSLIERKQVIVRGEWVKGHSDHVLNGVADRLAVLARRCHQSGVDEVKRRAISDEIVRDVLGVEPRLLGF